MSLEIGVIGHVYNILLLLHAHAVVLHYIGPGKEGTGDWCFRDGFITFEDLTELYNQHFKGRVLSIVSDCSYSGNWVNKAMTFMDSRGVKPCGHIARKKEILIKVYASCQDKEVPKELTFSLHCATTDRATGNMIFKIHLITALHPAVDDKQDPCGLDFTAIRCSETVNMVENCSLAPALSTWKKWSTLQRIYKFKKENEPGKPMWVYVKINADNRLEDFIKALDEGSLPLLDVSLFGDVLLTVKAENPPRQIEQYIREECRISYSFGHL